jgi:hypothetical protein
MSNDDELAYINYKLLKKARKQRRLSIEKASKDIIDSDILRKAENGELKINLIDFRLLAKRYKRTIHYFFLDKEPNIKLKIFFKKERMKSSIVHYLIKKWKIEV